jgi:hypothetical protein
MDASEEVANLRLRVRRGAPIERRLARRLRGGGLRAALHFR